VACTIVNLALTRNFRNVDEVHDGKVLDLLSNGEKRLVHLHARRVPIVTKPDDHDLVLFAKDGLKQRDNLKIPNMFLEVFIISVFKMITFFIF
jgi:hypothetical protein